MHSFPQYLQEDGGKDDPGSQKDSDGVGILTRVWVIGSCYTKAGDVKGSEGHPETTIRSEN